MVSSLEFGWVHITSFPSFWKLPGPCEGDPSALSCIPLLRLGSTLEESSAEGAGGGKAEEENFAQSLDPISPQTLSSKNSVLDSQPELKVRGWA